MNDIIIDGIVNNLGIKKESEFLKDHTENGKFVENSIEFKFPTLAQ